ncbi:MAG: hypothetical protein ACR2IV_00910, partial [Bryobacteraceae bacterium]
MFVNIFFGDYAVDKENLLEAHLCRGDMRRLCVVKFFQSLYTRQMSFPDAPLNRVPFTLFDL